MFIARLLTLNTQEILTLNILYVNHAFEVRQNEFGHAVEAPGALEIVKWPLIYKH